MTPLVAVLAAGRGTRFGGGKLDAICAGKPVGRWVLDVVAQAGLDPGVLIVGPDAPDFAIQADGWTLLTNPDLHGGLGGSLALAAQEALVRTSPLLVLLADMPLVDPDHLADLAESGALAATAWPGHRLGVPAYFPLDHLTALARLTGDQGAAAILSAQDEVQAIAPPPLMLMDIDKPEDLARVDALLRRRG